MLGAIIGDMIGSPYEWHNVKAKDFKLFRGRSRFTDDSVMTIAVADALLEAQEQDCLDDEQSVKNLLIDVMHKWGNRYPDAGYGGRFYHWLADREREPYNSWGNGSAMRVSPAGWMAGDMETTRRLARWTAEVTHNHPEGVKGAEAVAAAIFLARNGASKEKIKEYVVNEFGYDLDRTCDKIRPGYEFDVSCQGSVPEAIIAFLEGKDFEDVIRNAVSLGGDSDTIAAMAGSIAEAFFGIPAWMQQEGLNRLKNDMLDAYESFAEALGIEFVDAETLDDGKVLYTLKRMFLDEGTDETINALLGCLRDSVVKVPGKAVMSEADKKTFIEGIKKGVGATFTNESEIIFEPDILTDEDGNRAFPMFSCEDQIPEDYKQVVTMRDMYVIRCIQLAKADESLSGLVLDPFTEPVTIPFDIANIIDVKKSRIRIREDRRKLNQTSSFSLDGLTEEEFKELLESLDEGVES